ncbi:MULTISPECIES: hypothetical protein [Aliagarivorans]|uniref:hypothetical protein n=1 Tax=Aliagarivorans TaxID=882379 RepID=UPI00040DF2A1|nr:MULTISPECIES: hypothetical protein [Aliagarivorans]
MDTQQVIKQIQTNLKEIYHKAVDADRVLKQLSEQGHGKFNALFDEESLFKTHEREFLPYVEELASDLVLLEECEDEEHFVSQLKQTVAKLEQMHLLLAQFKDVAKAQ